MTSEQWTRAFALIRSLSDHPAQEVWRTLDQLTEDPAVLEKVRQTMASLDAPDTQCVRSGIQLGRYLVGSPVGAGSYGEVYQGLDTVLNRTVALKFLPATALLPKSAALNLVAEAQSASALNHPNIVTVHEVFETETGPVIVMELVEGSSLREVLREPITVLRAKQYAVQLLEALAAAHAKGIIHRDVKPENIMVRPDGYIKVLDFGLARQVEDAGGGEPLWGTGPVGTLRYMSPEQCAGGAASSASDIFSAGLVLCEMATGHHPFGGATPIETAELILREPPQPRSKGLLVSAGLKLLAKKPADRPTAEQALALLKGRQPLRPIWKFIVAAALFLLMGFVAFSYLREGSTYSLANQVPLTSSQGWESSPNISPDGQAVAYSYLPEYYAPTQIRIDRLDRESPTKLVEAAVGEVLDMPVWAPDGRSILFKSSNPNGGGTLWIIDADGTNRRKVKDLQSAQINSQIDWSPDGQLVAYADDAGPNASKPSIRVLNLATRAEHIVSWPPVDSLGDHDPKFSPDGRKIAFRRAVDFGQSHLLTASIEGHDAQQLTASPELIWGHAWTADGRGLIASRRMGGRVYALWRFGVDRLSPPEPLGETSTDNDLMPAWRAGKVAWTHGTDANNIYRIPVAGGKLSLVIGSNTLVTHPALAPDGRIAFVSRRSGNEEVWAASPDGSNPVRLTDLKEQVTRLVWSPDGRRLLFASSWHGRKALIAMDCGPGKTPCQQPHLVNTNGIQAEYPNWSLDGRYIYFNSPVQHRSQVFRTPADGGAATQITHGEESRAGQPSPDGKWLYFFRSGSIWRIQLDAASYSEEMIIGPPYSPAVRYLALTNDELILWDTGERGRPAAIRAYNLSTKRSRVILETHNAYSPVLSRDNRTLFFAGTDRVGGHINIIVANLNR